MSVKYTAITLKKLERIFAEAGYSLRFEKGSFQSGYCLLQDRRMVVVNKFLNQEGRIQALLDIAPILAEEKKSLSADLKTWYEKNVEKSPLPQTDQVQTKTNL